MSYTILSGPALATTKSDARYLALMDEQTRDLICNVCFSPLVSKDLDLELNSSLTVISELTAVLQFVSAVARQYKGSAIVLSDNDALTMALQLSKALANNQDWIQDIFPTLNIVLDAIMVASEANVQNVSVRFEGVNIQGIKQLSQASELKMTITAK